MNKKQVFIYTTLTMLMGLTSYGLAYKFYGWKLVLVMFIFHFSLNMSQTLDKHKKNE